MQTKIIAGTVLIVSMIIGAHLLFFTPKHKTQPVPISAVLVRAPETDKIREQKVQRAMWDVAKVFGRISGCNEASPELGQLVAEAAINHNVPANRLASVVATESHCNPFAISSRGAAGLGQVMISVWKTSFDFSGKINLFNEKDNLEVTATILASYIKDYGEEDGIRHYQGVGTNCDTCDNTYTSKVLTLAKGKP